MDFAGITDRGLVLLGCGKMGSALLSGWLAGGLDPAAVTVLDPNPSDWVRARGGASERRPARRSGAGRCRRQAADDGTGAAATGRPGRRRTLFLTVAAGTRIAAYEAVLGAATPLVRAMPNTPAAIGRGITALTGNAHATPEHLDLAERLLSAVGQTVRLDGEHQMDAVTAVSGSGPAYVFLLIETLARAGEAQGLPADLALRLARATVAGAGALAEQSGEAPEQLRVNVTSPGGTTAAALAVLMDAETGLGALLQRAVGAADGGGS